VRHRAELVPLLEQVMKTRPKADWLAALEAAKVPCGAINSLDEVFVDPHVQARGMVTHWQHALRADLPLVSSPIKLEKTPVRTTMPPPMLGQHTDEVLGELLGADALRLATLRERGII
jgi:crotonobetainyl-CoA:carnitine CoA-transferase CaiB-like acyl-CoA transferase